MITTIATLEFANAVLGIASSLLAMTGAYMTWKANRKNSKKD